MVAHLCFISILSPGKIAPWVYKHANVLVVVSGITVCAETDGADCSTQVYPTCAAPTQVPSKSPKTHAPGYTPHPTLPTTPAPTQQCLAVGEACRDADDNSCCECSVCQEITPCSSNNFQRPISMCVPVQSAACTNAPTSRPITVSSCTLDKFVIVIVF